MGGFFDSNMLLEGNWRFPILKMIVLVWIFSQECSTVLPKTEDNVELISFLESVLNYFRI